MGPINQSINASLTLSNPKKVAAIEPRYISSNSYIGNLVLAAAVLLAMPPAFGKPTPQSWTLNPSHPIHTLRGTESLWRPLYTGINGHRTATPKLPQKLTASRLCSTFSRFTSGLFHNSVLSTRKFSAHYATCSTSSKDNVYLQN